MCVQNVDGMVRKIKMNLIEILRYVEMDLTQDSVQWWAFVNTAMNPQILSNAGN
jgi:hypothetical protein